MMKQSKVNWPFQLSNFMGFCSLALGAVVLAGWYLHEPALIQVNPAFVPMQYNTALGFALAGLALLLLVWSRPRLAAGPGVAVLLVGVLTLIEYIFGVDLHIDQLFMQHYIDLETSSPGRMAPNTALCFSLTGSAILVAAWRGGRPGTPAWIATIGAIIIGLGIVAFAGYMIGVESAYGWGHLTRMAIHTAAGFMILGAGFVALAWAGEKQGADGQRLPRWIPLVIGITGSTITLALWQAMVAQERRMVSEMGPQATNYADESLLIFGLLLTLTLVFKLRAAVRVDQKGRGNGQTLVPYITVALGALLAFSLYSLLKTNFEAAVKSRFESAVMNHAEAMEHGIEAYLETLYHIRSGFDASSFVDRDEFRILIGHDLQRFPGTMALEWVPLVPDQEREAMEATARDEVSPGFVFGDKPTREGMKPAPRRERYLPIYYVEPLEPNLHVLGFDLAGRPYSLAALMKAAKTNAPVVSSRLQLFQSRSGEYSVFVALPVYRKGMPLESSAEREAAVKGFALMVTEIGPMIEEILNRYTVPAGLMMTFEDTDAADDKGFMYRHLSRLQAQDTKDADSEFTNDRLSSTTTLSFADRQWKVTAWAADPKRYPRWNADSLWLPLGVFLISLGLAFYLSRSAQREQERARILAYQSALLDSIPNPIFVKNTDTVFTACNKAYEKAFDIQREDFIGKTVLDLDYLPETRRKHAQEEDLDLIREGGLRQEETSLRYADGKRHDVMYWRTTFDVAAGEPGGLIGLFIDISERKQAEREIHRARQAAEAANQAKSAFLANMSHELRTPMNAILGYSEMLMEEAEDLEQEDFIPDLKKINQAGTHLLALINDVLDLSKIESGKMEAFAEDIDIDALIDEVFATAHPLMNQNSNQLGIERGKDLGHAHQDLTKLRQALFNLLSNAAKFTHEGNVTLSVERTREDGVDWLTFEVSDTGIGIPTDKFGHVFEAFSQADDSTTRNYGGTGLGLAISRRFCQLLGGDISVQSRPGKGSTFTIRLPAMLPGSGQQAPVETAPAKTAAEIAAIRQAGPGSTVLVIDDDPEACEIIERFLRKDGFEVASAGSGEEGLRIAHEIQPAAITLDVMMPDMDGWSVLRALKADPDLRKVPVVMLTMVDDKSKGYSLGATDYLSKPIDREQLHQVLARHHCPRSPCPVLLVEDDAATREMVARTINKTGWEVIEAVNGREALDQMAGVTPKLILLDLMMPVMDGFDFLLEMRTHAEWQHIPVIVLTAKDLTGEERRFLNGKVEQIVEKGSHSREQLMQLIRKVVVEGHGAGLPSAANRAGDGAPTG